MSINRWTIEPPQGVFTVGRHESAPVNSTNGFRTTTIHSNVKKQVTELPGLMLPSTTMEKGEQAFTQGTQAKLWCEDATDSPKAVS